MTPATAIMTDVLADTPSGAPRPEMTSHDKPAVLQVRDLSVDLGGRPVLRDVNLRIHPGQIVGLLGPNGAGKTTVMRTLLGLIPQRSGTVCLQPTQGRRRVLGYVPQRHDFAWDYPISVFDAVVSMRTSLRALWARPKRADFTAAAEALDRVQLSHLAHRPVGELSGGQRQRVLIARALATHPAVLLLDEPMTGLDMPAQEHLHTLFSSLAEQGEAMLVTTHDVPSALVECSTVYLLRQTIRGFGPPSALNDLDLWCHTYDVTRSSTFIQTLAACLGETSDD